MTVDTSHEELERLRSENAELRAENDRLRALEFEHAQTQASLRESEARYRSVVKALDDGIVLHDHDGHIVAWNESAERVLGLTSDQLRGRTSLDPRWQCVHPDGSPFPGNEHPGRRTLETGQPQEGVVMGVHKPDGSLSWISVNSRAIEQPGGTGKYSVVASFCDITTRVTVEQALREREAELSRALSEKEILLRELYHRTRNNMQVIRSMLALRVRFPSPGGMDRALVEITDRIRAMELVHQRLYDSSDLSTIHFRDYVAQLLPLLRDSHGVGPDKVAFRLDLSPIDLLIDTAIPCGLLLCELISNAFKHAFPGERAGTVRILLSEPAPGTVELVVTDDGVGFPDGFDPKAGNTLGLQVVTNLVEHQLQGRVTCENAGGARIGVHFNRSGYRDRISR